MEISVSQIEQRPASSSWVIIVTHRFRPIRLQQGRSQHIRAVLHIQMKLRFWWMISIRRQIRTATAIKIGQAHSLMTLIMTVAAGGIWETQHLLQPYMNSIPAGCTVHQRQLQKLINQVSTVTGDVYEIHSLMESACPLKNFRAVCGTTFLVPRSDGWRLYITLIS